MKDKKKDEIEKKNSNSWIILTKQIVIKRTWTKCQEITKWRDAFIFCRVSVENKEERGEEKKRVACAKPVVRL
jgi:hypothetical protein